MRGTGTDGVRGLVCSLGASALFGLIFYLAGVVDASPEAVFGWRMVITAGTFALVLATRWGRRALGEVVGALRRAWWAPLGLLFTSAMVGIQMWLFAWAPVHGYALDASLGYLLLPIVLVLAGRVAFADTVSRAQWCAVVLAGVAVAVKVVVTAELSWVVLAVCVGYALYFVGRRRLGLDLAVAFGVESVVVLPVAVALILVTDDGLAAGGDVVVLFAGVAGAAAMWAYVGASRLLSMPVFGLLSYLEPVLMFVGALLLGETLHGPDAVVYGLLAVALGVLGAEGVRRRGGCVAQRRAADPLEAGDVREGSLVD